MAWEWRYNVYAVISIISVIQPLQAQIITDSAAIHKRTFNKKIYSDSIDTDLVLPKFVLSRDSGLAPIKKPGIPKLSGRMGTEIYGTTFQNPRVLNEKQYLRTSGGVSFSWLDLPLLIDFYHTTENQNIYNSNYIKVSFDYNKFKDNIIQQWQSKQQEASSSLSNNQYKLNQFDKLEREISGQKAKLMEQQNGINEKLQENRIEYEAKMIAHFDSIEQSLKDSLQKSAQSQSDSSKARAHNRLNQSKDSMELDHLEKDQQRLNKRIQDLESQREVIEKSRLSLDSTIAADSVKFNHYKSLLADPEGQMTDWLKEKGYPSPLIIASKVKDFRMGIINPWLHNYSLAGLGMKGGQTTVNIRKAKLTVAIGKAVVTDLSNYNRLNTKFERFVMGAGVNMPFSKSLGMDLFGHFTKDPTEKFNSEGRISTQSTVLGANLLYRPKHLPLIDASVATSSFRVLNQPILSISYPSGGLVNDHLSRLAASSYIIKMEQSVFTWCTLEGSTQYVGPKFKNLGNPFMRTNFREHQLKSKFQVFHQQLILSAFYKALQDNPLRIAEITNRTSGYGISMNTRFKNKKVPNFNASISPYEQGNNHPDSLFRVNNHYSILTGGISYRTGRRVKYSNMTFLSQSKMQFSDTLTAMVRTLSIAQDLGLGKKFNFGLNTTFMRSYPGVDSVQANIHQLRVTFRTGKFSTLNASVFYAQYMNGAYRKGGSMNYTTKINKHFNFSIRGGYDRYYRIWGLKNNSALWGLCRLDWIL